MRIRNKSSIKVMNDLQYELILNAKNSSDIAIDFTHINEIVEDFIALPHDQLKDNENYGRYVATMFLQLSNIVKNNINNTINVLKANDVMMLLTALMASNDITSQVISNTIYGLGVLAENNKLDAAIATQSITKLIDQLPQ